MDEEARLASGLFGLLLRTSLFTSAVDSWSAPGPCVGRPSENVAGRWLSVLWPLRDRSCHVVRPQRDGIWQRSRDVQLLYCVRLSTLESSG